MDIHQKQRNRKNLFWIKASFLWPGTILLALFSILPFLYCVILSFYSWNLARPQWGVNFIGLGNFIELLRSTRFLSSVQTTFIILGGALCLQLLFGLLVALLLNTEVKGIKIVRAIIILPTVITPVVVGLLWLLLYKYEFGFVNFLLNLAGLPKIHWLTSNWGARLAIILADTWQWTPFIALVLFAGMAGIPKSLIEAASIDGANSLQNFRYITLPMIKPSILVALLIRTIDGFRMFEKIFAITKGGPGGATETLSFYIYNRGFDNFEMGIAAAASILFLIIVTIVAQIILKGFGARKLFIEG